MMIIIIKSSSHSSSLFLIMAPCCRSLCICFILLNVQNGAVPHDNLVLIKMKPDENGRFGFNVKVRLRNIARFGKGSVLEDQVS